MKTSPVLTDDKARQWQYTPDGTIRIDCNYWRDAHPRPRPEDIPQPWHYRLMSLLLDGARKVRW